MAALTAGGKVLARRLLAWDRARVAAREAQGYDGSAYKARQDLAEIAIDADVAAWPDEVRKLFMTVLEITRTPTAAGIEFGVPGRYRPQIARLTLVERMAYRALADEIGVRDRLREVSPKHWGDVDVEGN